MKRKTATARFEKTVQIESYEPETIAVEQTVELQEGDEYDEVVDQLHDENVAFVGREITARLAAKRMEDERDEDE